MISKIPPHVFLAIMALSPAIHAAPRPVTRESPSGLSLTQQLTLADTAADRYALLPNDSDFVYDFNTASPQLPNRKNFPALVGTGVSMATASFPACVVAPVHIHPRATELFLVTSGTIQTTLIPEFGAGPLPSTSNTANPNTRIISNTLTAGQMTVFPQGGFHLQINPTCENATAAAAFSSDDEGVIAIVPSLVSLNEGLLQDVFGQSLGAEEIGRVREAAKQGLALMEECKKSCGL
ncbi:RmlC-like cupin [Pseudovirgaria hyperparasitica]|uniref:RmlC-like cupin n=1 Tax=Pseudovirgaria hyperparasitica TaxID=470096 RepID=A0A6A6VUV0_9PEZI|nr:RmlC-like cupin [Pseudovirgaria hyperparasitica]KAF2754342.1 RmlC-like cupin [Pseudovirgaria hyperparasitica]